MRSIETEGAAVRRIDLLTLQTFGAALGQALIILKADDQTAEAGPAFLGCAS